MRTTVTLDDDVAAELERRREERGLSFKQAINEALRVGMAALDAPGEPVPHPRTRPLDLGHARIDLDDVSDVLAWAEGESHR